jgi:hypothetical protein
VTAGDAADISIFLPHPSQNLAPAPDNVPQFVHRNPVAEAVG